MNLQLGNFLISLFTFLTCFLQSVLSESYLVGIIMASVLAANIILMRLFMAMHETTDGNVFLETKHSNALGALFMVLNVLTVVFINLHVDPVYAFFVTAGYFIDLSKMTDFGLHGITLGSEVIAILMIDKYSFNLYHSIACLAYIIFYGSGEDDSDTTLYIIVILPFLYFFRLLPDLTLIPLVLMEKLHIHLLGGSACYTKLRLCTKFVGGIFTLGISFTLGYYTYPFVGVFLISFLSPILATDFIQYRDYSYLQLLKKPPTMILCIHLLLSTTILSDYVSSQTMGTTVMYYYNFVIVSLLLLDILLMTPTIFIFMQNNTSVSIKAKFTILSNSIYSLNSIILSFFITSTWSLDLNTLDATTPFHMYVILFVAGAKLTREAWTLPISLLHSSILLLAFFGINTYFNNYLTVLLTTTTSPYFDISVYSKYNTLILFAGAAAYPIFKRYMDNIMNIFRFGKTYLVHGYNDNDVRFQLVFIVCTLPWNILVALICAITDSVYCPLFGLPLFWIDCSRSTKFFWNTDEEDAHNIDSAMYSNFSKLFKQTVHKNYLRKLTGTEGNNCLLIRNEYLSYFVQTVEVGYGYAIFQFKGLELEPTSCHNREILYVDECIKKQSFLSMSFFDVFRPIGTAELMTMELCFFRLNGYSSREFLIKFLKNFNASLLWVFGNLKSFNLGEYSNRPPDSLLYTAPIYLPLQMKEDGYNINPTFENLFQHIVNSYSTELISFQDSQLDFWLPDLYDTEIITDYVDEFSRTVRSIEKPVSLAIKFAVICTVQQLMALSDQVDYYTEFTKFQNTFFLHLRVQEDIDEWYKATSVIPKEVYCLSKKMYNFGLDEDMTSKSALLILKRKISNVHVVHVNTSTAKSIWSNLLFEVGYRGTVDEERYSIQAEKHLLRNTLSQLAHYPYGWTSYSGIFKINVADMYT